MHDQRARPTTCSTANSHAAARPGPRDARRTCSSTSTNGEAARRTRRSSRCRRGRSSSRRSRRTTRRSPRRRARSRRHRSFVLKDRPALTGDDITDPEQNFDPRPTSRTSPSTSPTRAGRRSRTSPGRSPSAARRPRRPGTVQRRGGRPVLAALRDRPRQRGRLAADHQLRREPGRDRRPHRAPRSPAASRSGGAGPRRRS